MDITDKTLWRISGASYYHNQDERKNNSQSHMDTSFSHWSWRRLVGAGLAHSPAAVDAGSTTQRSIAPNIISELVCGRYKCTSPGLFIGDLSLLWLVGIVHWASHHDLRSGNENGNSIGAKFNPGCIIDNLGWGRLYGF